MNYKMYISPNYCNNNLQEVSIEREINTVNSGMINSINEIYNYLSNYDEDY